MRSIALALTLGCVSAFHLSAQTASSPWKNSYPQRR